MAKSTKRNSKKEEEAAFREFYNQQPEEFREMLDMFNICSFDDLVGLSMMMGIDLDKMEKYKKEHGPDVMPKMEDIMFDEDDPNGDIARALRKINEISNDETKTYEELDPFQLPENLTFKEEPILAYHLRIKLNYAPVPIWREVEVPSNISLELFAFVIIEVMGWENEHLHQFRRKDTIYKNRVCIKQDQEMFGFFNSRFTTLASDDYPISAIFKEKGDRILFEYDFGDSWEHDIWLKGIREYRSDEEISPYLLKGKGACPPEDCGGIGGYAYLLDTLSKKRKSAEDKAHLEWYGIDKDYDPNDFDFDYSEDNLYFLWSDAFNK